MKVLIAHPARHGGTVLRKPCTQELIVRFVRIGQDREVPDLQVRGDRAETVRDQIRTFVSERLGTTAFFVQLWDTGGLIDRGTHSDGAFIFRRNESEDDQCSS